MNEIKRIELERELAYAKANREHLKCFFIWFKLKRLKRKEKI